LVGDDSGVSPASGVREDCDRLCSGLQPHRIFAREECKSVLDEFHGDGG
jgi:hypothetical protein